MEKLLGLLFIALILSTPAAFASAKAKLDAGQEQQEVLSDDQDSSSLPGLTPTPPVISLTPTPQLIPVPLEIKDNFQADSSLRQFFNLLKRLLFTLRSPTSPSSGSTSFSPSGFS